MIMIRNPRHRHLLLAFAALAVIGGLGVVMALRDDPALQARAANAPSAPEVDVAPVVARTITDWQSYSGRLEAIEKVDIRPLVSGTIVAVHFRDGRKTACA